MLQQGKGNDVPNISLVFAAANANEYLTAHHTGIVEEHTVDIFCYNFSK